MSLSVVVDSEFYLHDWTFKCTPHILISEVIGESINLYACCALGLNVKRYHSWNMCDFWRGISVVYCITEYSSMGFDIQILC